jgi:acyl-CoA reductase-like NAD-dependent aldehyde dehydrogenase
MPDPESILLQTPKNRGMRDGTIRSGSIEIPFFHQDATAAVEAADACIGEQRETVSIPESLQSVIGVLERNRDRFFRIAREESGRTEMDLDAEFKAAKEYLQRLIENREVFTGLHPRGVSVVIGSAVWPVYFGIQFCIANLVCGNPVILKPSEKTARLSLEWVQALRQVSDWFRAIQVVVGDRETGRRLVNHSKTDLILFQGTYEAGMRVRQDTLANPGKEVLLFLGSKNPVIIGKNPDSGLLDLVLRDAFLGAGQTCMNGPLLFVRQEDLDDITNALKEKNQLIASQIQEGASWVGPLFDSAALERYLKFVSTMEREGGIMISRGNRESAHPGSCYALPTIVAFPELAASRLARMSSFQTEFPGPHLSVVPFQTREQLQDLIGSLSYGMSCALHAGDSLEIEGFLSRRFGRVLRNKSLFDFDVWASPAARKKSGNHAKPGMDLFRLVSVNGSRE